MDAPVPKESSVRTYDRPSPGPFTFGSPLVRSMCEHLATSLDPKAARVSHSLLAVLHQENNPEAKLSPERETASRVVLLTKLMRDLSQSARRLTDELNSTEHNALIESTGRELTEHMRALGEFIAATAAHADELIAQHVETTEHTRKAVS